MKKIIPFLIFGFLFIVSACHKQDEPRIITYQIKLVYDDNTITKVVPKGKSLAALPELTKEGHEFLGWFQIDGEDKKQFNPRDIINNDLELHPLFTPKEYEITIYYGEQKLISKVLYENPLVMPEAVLRTGYALKVINYLTGKDYNLGALVRENLVLYVNYDAINNTRPTYNCELILNNEATNILTLKVYQGDLLYLPVPRLEGYEFSNFYDSKTNTTHTKKILPKTDLTLSAKFKIKQYYVTFYANAYGGSDDVKLQVKHNENIGEKVPPFNRSDVRFLYWADKQGLPLDPNEPVVNNLFFHPVFVPLPKNEAFFNYEIINNEVTILGLNNNELKYLVIPQMINDYPVRVISDYAFKEGKFKEVILPLGLKSIGKGVFYQCDELTSVTLPQDMQTIPTEMFMFCRMLKKITLPAKVKTIQAYAFYYASSLINITWPIALKTISEYAFYYTNFSHLNLPVTLTTIGAFAFYFSHNLGQVIFNEGLEVIADYAFANSAKLLVVNLPYSLAYLGKYAFANCGMLREITLYDTVQNIAAYHFSGYNNLSLILVYKTKVSLPFAKKWNYDYENSKKHYYQWQ